MSGAEEAITVTARLSANNAEALCASLEAGEGIALQPDFIAWEAVRDGRLVVVLADWTTAAFGTQPCNAGRRTPPDPYPRSPGLPHPSLRGRIGAMDSHVDAGAAGSSARCVSLKSCGPSYSGTSSAMAL